MIGYTVAVIDPGGSRAIGEGLYVAIRRITDKPISHVILSHMHPDHIYGAEVFAAAGAEIIADRTISTNMARKVFDTLWNGEGGSADDIIASQGLQQITDHASLERLIDELLATNATMVAEFRAGKEKAFNALVGQAMKATRGKANPQQVNELLRRKLG